MTPPNACDLENYERFRSGMILRDYLARDRTALASERTLLAYVRTFAGLFASGMGVLKLFDSPLASIAGSVLIVVSPVFLAVGFYRFFRIHKLLKPLSVLTSNSRTKQENFVQAEVISENPR